MYKLKKMWTWTLFKKCMWPLHRKTLPSNRKWSTGSRVSSTRGPPRTTKVSFKTVQSFPVSWLRLFSTPFPSRILGAIGARTPHTPEWLHSSGRYGGMESSKSSSQQTSSRRGIFPKSPSVWHSSQNWYTLIWQIAISTPGAVHLAFHLLYNEGDWCK